MTTLSSAVEDAIISGLPNVADLGLFIICCIIVVSLVLFFLFYFNRVVARLITLVVNQYLWRRYEVYIQLDSVRVTLLGARILFKNFRLHTTDASFSVFQGHITLQYWLYDTQKSNSCKKDNTKLPCRIICSVEGLEGFIYNNALFYQRIKAILGLEPEDTPAQRSMDSYGLTGTPSVLDPENQTLSELSWLQRFLPIQLECTTAAIIIGNQQLQSYVVLKASQANGTIDIGPSRTTMDYCKATVELMLRKPQVSLEQNQHYTAKYQHVNSVRHHQRTFGWWKDIYQWMKWILCIGSATDGNKDTDQQIEQEGKNDIRSSPHHPTYHKDYAKIESIVECSQLALCYYMDIPGPVPNTAFSHGYTGSGPDIGNGGLPPECGARVSLWNAVVNYGPWADKERLSIHDYFVPNPHRTNVPTARLLPGETRVHTSFDLMLDFMTEFKIRVATREISKDWKYTGDISHLDIDKDGYYTRPYGWIDVKFKEGSTLKALTPLVISSDGYLATLDLDLKGGELATSVNFANLAQANGVKIHIDMPFPLVWNEHRIWTLNISAKKPDVFVLRDHVFLLQDLVKDWISIVTPPDLLHFVPITYQAQLDTSQANVYLCINEHNIINYPNSMDDNAFLDIHVQKVRVNAIIPLVTFQPEVMSITYSAQLDQIHGGLSLQPSHTRSSFMKGEDSEIFSCRSLSLQGSHETYTSLDVLRHIESATMNLKLQGAMVKLFGSVIRYLIILRDNYAGSSLHFCTIDEYRQRRSNPKLHLESRKKELEAKPLSDPFEFSLTCQIEDVVALLPENLYECSHYSQLEFQELQLELRNLDIYADMYITITPITWTRDCNPNPTTRRSQFKMKNGRDPRNFLYVDGVNLHAHRLIGPLPEIATYLCHWEFDIGSVKGEIKPSFLVGVASFAKTFIYNLIDEDNAVSSESLVKSTGYPEVIFATANVQQVDVCLMTQNTASQLQLQDGLRVEFDNLTNEKYSQRVSTQLPAISITSLANQESGDQQQDVSYSWVEVARVELGLNLTIFRHTKEWKKNRMAQQQFIRLQDTLTGRCKHLYDGASTATTQTSSAKSAHDHHVGVFYAPLFRSGSIQQTTTQDESISSTSTNNENGYASISTDTSAIQGLQYYFYSDDDYDDEDVEDDDYSMMSFNEQWPTLSNTLKPAIHSVSPYDDDENDSFRTAEYGVEDRSVHFATNLSSSSGILDTTSTKSTDEASVVTPSDVDNEEFDTDEYLGYTVTSIPPSIPYSGYLNRFAVKRAANLVGRGQSFFHSYAPPPKTTFIPLKAKNKKQDEDFGEYGAHFFAGLEEDDLNANFSSSDEHENDINQQSDVVVTSILEASCPVKVLMTPILVKVVQEMTEVINKADWDLETMLDSTQIEYVGQLTRYLTDKFICARFAFWLPSVHLHFIQNVMIPADLPSYSEQTHDQPSHLKTLYDDHGDMLCAVDIFLDNFQMIGGLTFQDYAFQQKQIAESNLVLEESRLHINLGNLGCKVHYVSDCYETRRQVMFGIPKSRQHVHGRYDWDNGEQGVTSDSNSDSTSSFSAAATELVVLDFSLDNFGCKWVGAKNPNYLDFGISDVTAIIITESVEILVGAAYSWLGFVDDLQQILTRFQTRRSRQMQVLIHELAQFSSKGGPSIGDYSGGSAPQFLTIPTNMGLRLGSKKNFRNDVGWKLLARMRQCLRGMPLTSREKLQYMLTSGGAIEHIDSSAMYGHVVRAFSGWRSWEIDSKDIKNCRLFIKTFNQQRKITNAATTEGLEMGIMDYLVSYLKTSMNCGKFKVNRFDFCIYEEEPDAYDNRIIVEPLEFTADTVYKTLVFGTETLDQPPSSTSTTSSSSSEGTSIAAEGYLDIIGKVDIGSVEISVNPTILAFAQHMLTVQWVFTSKLKIFSDNGLSSLPTRQHPQQLLDITLLLSRIDVIAHALIRIQHVHLGAWAQKLTMTNDLHGIHGSVVFSNPKLSPLANHQQRQQLAPSEKNVGTASTKPSSNRTSRKQSINSSPHLNRVIVNASGGVESLDVGFYELLSLGSYWSTNTSNGNSVNINKKYGFNTTTGQPSKRINTKLLTMKITDAKISANISQPTINRSNRKSKSSVSTEITINDKPKEMLKVLSSVETVDVDVPQSLLRLYSFVEEWRSEQGKRYHFMFQNLINEWEEQRRVLDTATPLEHQLSVESDGNGQQQEQQQQQQGMGILSLLWPEFWYDIKFQFLLVKCVAKADLLRSLSVKYSIDDLLVLVDETQGPRTPTVINYALQLSKQDVELITHHRGNMNQLHPSATLPPLLNHTSTSGAFNLPGIRTSGTLMQVTHPSLGGKIGFQLQVALSVDVVAMSLDVSMIDSILTAHNLLENEINELVEILSYSKKGRGQGVSAIKKKKMTPSSYAPFRYSVAVSLDGISIKALSPLATGLFESNALEASMSNYNSSSSSSGEQPLLWNISGRNLSLSLDHGESTTAAQVDNLQKEDGRIDINHRNRLAYFVVDFNIQNRLIMNGNTSLNQQITSYDILATRVQAVMQPVAIGKLAEMYIYYDSELKKKKEIKREEIEQLAINTKRIVESFHPDSVTLKEQDIQRLLEGRQFSLVVEKLGVAIPLSDVVDDLVTSRISSTSIEQQQTRHHAALLFALSSLQFTTRSLKTTTATIEGITLQFVKRFDQANEDHFMACNHPRMNMARFPSITCFIGTTFEKTTRKLGVQIETKVHGCEVDLDGSIGHYISRLGIIYLQSADKFNNLTFNTNNGNNKSTLDTIHSFFPGNLILLDIEGNFDYDTSVIRLHPKRRTSESIRKRDKSTNRGSARGHGSTPIDKDQNDNMDVAAIRLPRFVAEFKYQTPLGALIPMVDFPHRLHLGLLVHESSNLLHPSLVQFMQEAHGGLKKGLRLANLQRMAQDRIKQESSSALLGIFGDIDASILLRLSKSRLDFTCSPASKVICSLVLNSSEFMTSSIPSFGTGRSTTCFGTLRRVSMEIKHHFSPQSCLGINVDNVILNAALVPTNRGEDAHFSDSLSIIIKVPSVEGEINMRHLQDLLILNFCWFPQRVAQQDQEQLPIPQQSHQPFQLLCACYMTLAVDKVVLSTDMGQAIGKLTLAPNHLLLHAHMIPGVSQGVGISLDNVLITSEGRLTGEAKLYRVIVEARVNTKLLSVPGNIETSPPGQLYVSTDGFRANFTYEYQHILDLVLEPSRVTATVGPMAQGDQHQIKAGIYAGRLIANISLKTVPVMIVMQKRFMELLERKRDEADAIFISWIHSNTKYGGDALVGSLLSRNHQYGSIVDSSPDGQHHPDKPWPISFVEIYGEKLQLIIYPSQFQDGDNLEIQLVQVKAILHQASKGNQDMHRHVTVSLSKAYLLKNVPGQEIIEKRKQGLVMTMAKQAMDKGGMDIGQTGDDSPINDTEASTKQTINEMGTFILGLPDTKISMESIQVMRKVHHTSTVDFMDRLGVSLNIGQLKYIQELIRISNEQIARAKKTADSIGGTRNSYMTSASPSPSEEDMQLENERDDTISLDSGIGVGHTIVESHQLHQQQRQPSKCTETDFDMMATDTKDDPIDDDDDKQRLIYTTDRIIHFDPQIRQMGDATPPVEWLLGIKREWIPGLLHEKITLSLDLLVHIIWKLYQTQT